MIPAALSLITSFFLFKLITFFACSFKDSENFVIESLLLYTSMLLNDGIVDLHKLDRICSLDFVAVEFAGLFLHPSIFSNIHSRSA